jgi:hypothetical protein
LLHHDGSEDDEVFHLLNHQLLHRRNQPSAAPSSEPLATSPFLIDGSADGVADGSEDGGGVDIIYLLQINLPSSCCLI